MMDFKEGAKLDVSLTPEELATLREHGLAVFRGKLILKAQPPITAEQLAEVERRVGAPVPHGLRRLLRAREHHGHHRQQRRRGRVPPPHPHHLAPLYVRRARLIPRTGKFSRRAA